MKHKKIQAKKEEIRSKLLLWRRSLSLREVEEKSASIERQLFSLSEWKQSKTVMFYLSFDSEVQTDNMIKEGLKEKKAVVVPLCEPHHHQIIPSRLYDFDRELSVGYCGIREPRREFVRPLAPGELDLVFVPGVSFDREGNRLGFGAGFYDRFLIKLPEHAFSVALAYEEQLVTHLPHGENDIKVNIIVTENKIYYC